MSETAETMSNTTGTEHQLMIYQIVLKRDIKYLTQILILVCLIVEYLYHSSFLHLKLTSLWSLFIPCVTGREVVSWIYL